MKTGKGQGGFANTGRGLKSGADDGRNLHDTLCSMKDAETLFPAGKYRMKLIL